MFSPPDAFTKRQSQLRTVVENNDGFIRDTDIKIDRAEKKAKEEWMMCRKKGRPWCVGGRGKEMGVCRRTREGLEII